jgi:hypothetical protein
MTAMLNYGVFPPELNSARMYASPGSGSLLTAASAWDDMAADLRSQAANYGSAVEGLTSGEWHGPASTSTAAAAVPYVAWMNTTAAQAERGDPVGSQGYPTRQRLNSFTPLSKPAHHTGVVTRQSRRNSSTLVGNSAERKGEPHHGGAEHR